MSYRNVATACALALAISACGAGDEVAVVPGVIDRATFIDAYVDLRVRTLDATEISLPMEERDRILGSHGIGADDLLGFVDAYGRDLDFIDGVWSEIEHRLDSLSQARLDAGEPRRPS